MDEIWLSTEELQTRLARPDLVLLDARPSMVFLLSHLPRAVNVGWREFSDPAGAVRSLVDPDSGRLAQKLGALGVRNDVEVVVYGDPIDGSGEDGRIWWTLNYLGHPRARLLNGGFFKWKNENRPIERGPARAKPASFTARVDPSWLMLKDELKGRLSDPALALADARSPGEYQGAVGAGIARGGRIPGAKNLPFDAFYNADGTIKPPAAIAAAARAAGITPDQEVVTYCVGGVRSAWLFVLLATAGYPKLRNYAGSWWEWSTDPALPVEK